MLTLRVLPNVLTVARMLLVAPLLVLLVREEFLLALLLALALGLSDGLDGALARRFRWQTRLGGILDPLADKLLLVGVFATLSWLGHIPPWLLARIVLRDLVIVAGAAVYHYRIETLQPEPTRLSKLNTVCQLLLMWAVLTALAGLAVPPVVLDALVWIVSATVLGSLVQYVAVWSLRARAVVRRRVDGR